MNNRFADGLKSGRFVVSFESVPRRGANEPSQQELENGLVEVWESGLVDAVTVADMPSGIPGLRSESYAASLAQKGVNTISFLTCKDRDRNALEAELYSFERSGIQNILCMTGDYPKTGWNGVPKPSFDLDSIQLLNMTSQLNSGLEYKGPKGADCKLQPTHFYQGCAVNPFKFSEAETMMQLWKLKKKVQAGAKFAICQIGYDARKQQEMLWLARENGIDIPLIANVYVLRYGIGKVMHDGKIPGCYVDDLFLDILEKEAASDDGGVAASLDRAAKMIAIAKGEGFAGVHLAGIPADPAVVENILEMARGYESSWEDFVPNLKFAPAAAFMYYGEDSDTGLNSHEIPEDYYSYPVPVVTPRKGYSAAQALLPSIGEQVSDNSIEMSCDLWPVVDCPKMQRNCPCGGSHKGFCEVYPENKCIWVDAYSLLNMRGEHYSIAEIDQPPLNWE